MIPLKIETLLRGQVVEKNRVEYANPDTHLIYLKCSAGDAGPYQAPVDVYSKKGEKSDKIMKYWIRPASLTTAAKPTEISELYEKFNSIPYDDRINRTATLDNIRRATLKIFCVIAIVRWQMSSMVEP